VPEEPALSAPCFTRLTQIEKQEQHLLDPPERRQGGRLQIGTMAGFKSERVAGFNLECMAGFIGIRILGDFFIRNVIEIIYFLAKLEGKRSVTASIPLRCDPIAITCSCVVNTTPPAFLLDCFTNRGQTRCGLVLNQEVTLHFSAVSRPRRVPRLPSGSPALRACRFELPRSCRTPIGAISRSGFSLSFRVTGTSSSARPTGATMKDFWRKRPPCCFPLSGGSPSAWS
jgi:hypothetical protein